MKIADVKLLPPLERFLYWARERHQIALRRRAGKPRPWTDDEILQSYFFTHPYREMDKVTVWFRDNVRGPLRNDEDVLFATVAFRWFNYIPTGEKLLHNGWLYNWEPDKVIGYLSDCRAEGQQLFTGAFMINSPAGKPKLEAIVERITAVWEAREELLARWHADFDPESWGGVDDVKPTMEGFHKSLMTFPGLGGFMAYEIVCDLRYTYLLENATDILTWCNVGPGAIRGLCRILEIDFEKGRNAHGFKPKVPIDEQEECRNLLKTCWDRLKMMPKFEMREVEHSCCEFDKYERLLWADGRAKRTYPGRG